MFRVRGVPEAGMTGGAGGADGRVRRPRLEVVDGGGADG